MPENVVELLDGQFRQETALEEAPEELFVQAVHRDETSQVHGLDFDLSQSGFELWSNFVYGLLIIRRRS
ncbi:MAG: hypothetical protein OXU63_15000, partial [Acidobacteriota bacterium]|nr:hypothetical protein [Acidobacteriota bacterium]